MIRNLFQSKDSKKSMSETVYEKVTADTGPNFVVTIKENGYGSKLYSASVKRFGFHSWYYDELYDYPTLKEAEAKVKQLTAAKEKEDELIRKNRYTVLGHFKVD